MFVGVTLPESSLSAPLSISVFQDAFRTGHWMAGKSRIPRFFIFSPGCSQKLHICVTVYLKVYLIFNDHSEANVSKTIFLIVTSRLAFWIAFHVSVQATSLFSYCSQNPWSHSLHLFLLCSLSSLSRDSLGSNFKRYQNLNHTPLLSPFPSQSRPLSPSTSTGSWQE